MLKVKMFVDRNLSSIKTISDVAKGLTVSSETLRKDFLRQERIHLGDFILFRKVLKMKEHLIISDDPCWEVCESAGLRDDTGARIFKKFTGMTMLAFRRKYRQKFLVHNINPLLFEKCELHITVPEDLQQFKHIISTLSTASHTTCPPVAETKPNQTKPNQTKPNQTSVLSDKRIGKKKFSNIHLKRKD